MNRSIHRGQHARFPLAALAAAVLLMSQAKAGTPSANQLPTQGQVVAGQAALRTQGNTLTVTQASQRAVIDWQRFDLGSQARVVFDQAAGSRAATLNRVLGGNPSVILGRIDAPGQVFITNASGVIFGSTASVNVGGLVASSLSLSNADFMAGKFAFTQGSQGGAVINAGTLTAADGGYVALLGPEVRNEGVIAARAGAVVLAGGEAIELAFDDARLATVQVTPAQIRTLVENRNAVLAPDGWVLLSARSAQALQGSVINQNGVIKASSLVNSGGRVTLEADAISLGASSRIDASGAIGGGTVLVGGDWQGSGTMHQAQRVDMAAGAQISADATQSGRGGRIVLWSDTSDVAGATRVLGSLSAQGAGTGRGGQIETSGHSVQLGGAQVNAGHAGQWLTDPTDLTIDSSTATTYANSLAAGTNVVAQASGDLTLAAPIAWTTTAALDLKAGGDLWLRDTISTTQGSLILRYGLSQPNAGNPYDYHVLAPISLGSGAHFSTQRGSDGALTPWTIITSLGTAGDSNGITLQGMAGVTTGHYVLGADIDASATVGWNGGQGFNPIGSSGTPFSGQFDGLGHVVSGLTIDRTTSKVGLFGVASASAQLRNVGLSNVAIKGNDTVGGLVGSPIR